MRVALRSPASPRIHTHCRRPTQHPLSRRDLSPSFDPCSTSTPTHYYATNSSTPSHKMSTPTTRPDHGRPGMDYWSILVLASVRLGCNLNYDRLQNLAEEHRSLRLIMRVSGWDQPSHSTGDAFATTSLCSHLTPSSGSTTASSPRAIAWSPDAAHTVRCDSFVVAADIHYSTDSGLIGDGLRVIIRTSRRLAGLLGQPGCVSTITSAAASRSPSAPSTGSPRARVPPSASDSRPPTRSSSTRPTGSSPGPARCSIPP